VDRHDPAPDLVGRLELDDAAPEHRAHKVGRAGEGQEEQGERKLIVISRRR